MTSFVPRTCTEIGKGGLADGAECPSSPLEGWARTDAYVLLGPAGAGKTMAFDREAQRSGGYCVAAHDFIAFDEQPEWRDTTLFIDGLDETRAGSADGRTPLDRIRAKLDRLGRPRFRLSCREADWFGAHDRDRLKTVSRDGRVTVLRLDPLSDDQVREILGARPDVDDADAFIASARRTGLDGLLANPQSLGMLAAAVADGVWPETRTRTFDLACRTLLVEHNREHGVASRVPASTDELLAAAGRLCAVQLLTGSAGYALDGARSDREHPVSGEISGGDGQVLRQVLGTKLFEAPSEGRAAPVHRHIAEFLGGGYLADIVENGVPVGRILALMAGHDGVVVSGLRGLAAWLAAHSHSGRAEIAERDPLGTVLHGDVKGFSRGEKRRMLRGLERETEKDPWFPAAARADPRLGDLATPDMGAVFRELLTGPGRDTARQSFVSLLIESLGHGPAAPELAGLMMTIVRDGGWWSRIRRTALDAFIRYRGDGEGASAELEALLGDTQDGPVSDPDDDILGTLLNALYPDRLSQRDIQKYLKPPKNTGYFGRYRYFLKCHSNSRHTELRKAIIGLRGPAGDAAHASAARPAAGERNAMREERRRREHECKAKRRRREWRDRVKPQEAALRANRCPPALLDELAAVYHGYFVGVEGDSPEARLRNVLGDDAGLIGAVLKGFRGSIGRTDVPDDAEILRLATAHQRHCLALPFLAGLEEMFPTAPSGGWPLGEKQARQALACHYTTLLPAKPKWIRALLISHPHAVVDVLLRFSRSEWHGGGEAGIELHLSVSSADHEAVARRAVLPLLDAFPVRCKARQLPELGALLKAALLRCEKAPLVERIDRKLACRGMNVAQRVYWRAAGLVAEPGRYHDPLKSYVAGRERRIRHLARFAVSLPGVLIDRLDVAALALLVRLLGPAHRPRSRSSARGPVWVTPAMEAAERIEQLARRLASLPDPQATKVLEALSSEEGLRPWRSLLVDAAYRQNAVRREAGFRHCGVGQVLGTLDNRQPANIADLAALTAGFLREIARTLRDGDESGWRAYWNVDPHGRPREARPEGACRDALLSALRSKTRRLGIDAQPEGRYADDRRADIRVACSGFNVPVEIKKCGHRRLWSAIKDQSIARYTRDPGAGGYGIYVVFWFGENDCQPPGSGRRPGSAAELEERLRDLLSAEEKRTISVCVIDVARPGDRERAPGHDGKLASGSEPRPAAAPRLTVSAADPL